MTMRIEDHQKHARIKAEENSLKKQNKGIQIALTLKRNSIKRVHEAHHNKTKYLEH